MYKGNEGFWVFGIVIIVAIAVAGAIFLIPSQPAALAPYCRDRKCDAGETCSSCPNDCGSCQEVKSLPEVKPPSEMSSGGNNTSVSANKTNLFGTMIAYNVNDGFMGAPGAIDELQRGWTILRNDSQTMEEYTNSLEQLFNAHDELVEKTNFSSDRGSFALFTWNVIEPKKGTFDWTLVDLAAEHARKARIRVSAVVQPFASWDQKGVQTSSVGQPLDYAWYDYKAGPPNDWAEYQNFLGAAVKRYKDVVSSWEIGNEYEGCCGYQNDPDGYLKLLKLSYETIKRVDPSAKVLNGGALEFPDASIKTFWTKFFQLGGGNYLDIFNVHYNSGKNGAKSDSSEFLSVLNFYNNLIKNQGLTKPLWISEFGTYSGTPQRAPGQPPGPASAFPSQSPEFQAAWYFRYSIMAFANNVERVFIDFIGQDDQNVGASAIYNLQGQSRLFLKTLETIATKLEGFGKVEKIADGQYKFTVGGENVYALWSGNLPSGITGRIKVTDLYGQEKDINASDAKFSSQLPIFVEVQSTSTY